MLSFPFLRWNSPVLAIAHRAGAALNEEIYKINQPRDSEQYQTYYESSPVEMLDGLHHPLAVVAILHRIVLDCWIYKCYIIINSLSNNGILTVSQLLTWTGNYTHML